MNLAQSNKTPIYSGFYHHPSERGSGDVMREPVINVYRVFSSASGLSNQNYHFNEICKWFIGTLKCGLGSKDV